jgi:hypothetical protein
MTWYVTLFGMLAEPSHPPQAVLVFAPLSLQNLPFELWLVHRSGFPSGDLRTRRRHDDRQRATARRLHHDYRHTMQSWSTARDSKERSRPGYCYYKWTSTPPDSSGRTLLTVATFTCDTTSSRDVRGSGIRAVVRSWMLTWLHNLSCNP